MINLMQSTRRKSKRSPSIFLMAVAFMVGLSASCAKRSVPANQFATGNINWPIEARDSSVLADISQFQLRSLDGDHENAMQELQNALKEDPNSAYIHFNLAVLYLKQGDLKQSEKHIEKTLISEPKHVSALRLKARLKVMSGKMDEAIGLYEQLLNIKTNEELVQDTISLSALYMDQKDIARAEKVLETYLDNNGEHAVVRFFLGRIYIEQGDLERAKQQYEMSLKANADYLPALKSIALIYEYQGKESEAVTYFEKFLKKDPNNHDIRFYVATLYMKLKQPKKAITQIEKVFEDDPKNEQALLKLGLYYFQQKRFQDSEKMFRSFSKAHPEKTGVLYYLGLLLEEQGKEDEALDKFAKVDPQEPTYPDAQLMQAQIWVKKKKFSEAAKHLEKAIENIEDPERKKHIVSSYVQILFELKQYKDAETHINAAIKASPEEPEYFFLLGRSKEEQKDYPAFEKNMLKCLDLNPNHLQALNYLGYSYAERGVKLDASEQYLKRAIEIEPDNAYVLDSLGWLYFQKNNYEKAEKFLKKALAIKPDEAIIWEHLGDVYLKQDKKVKAKNAYQKALSANPDAETKLRLEKKYREPKL